MQIKRVRIQTEMYGTNWFGSSDFQAGAMHDSDSSLPIESADAKSPRNSATSSDAKSARSPVPSNGIASLSSLSLHQYDYMGSSDQCPQDSDDGEASSLPVDSPRSEGDTMYDVLPSVTPDVSSWVPGASTGSWLRDGILPQARVLLANAVTNIAKLPRKLLRQILQAMGCQRRVGRGIHWDVSGHVLGLSPNFVRGRHSEVCFDERTSQWMPAMPRGALEEDHAKGVAGSDWRPPVWAESAATVAMLNLVTLAVVTASEGRTQQSFIRDAFRWHRLGAPLGDRYQSREFIFQVVSLAALILRQMDSLDFNAELGGLGIPSDFGSLVDAVAIGSSLHPRNDTLFVHCLAIVNVVSGQVMNPLHSATPQPLGCHAGKEMVACWMQTFTDHPAAWGTHTLKARLSAPGGDGATVQGGPDARHQSTGAAEKLWLQIHPTATFSPAIWDMFHRVDERFISIIKECQM